MGCYPRLLPQLVEKIPEYLVNKEKIKANIKDYLSKEGFTQPEISSLSDARYATVAYKASLWDEHQKKVAETASNLQNKVIKKFVKGSTIDSDTRERTKQLITRARNSKSKEDKRLALRAIASEAGLFKEP